MQTKNAADKKKKTAVADFLYEVGILNETPRSWTFFAGGGKQSVAEHLNRTTYIGYVLAMMSPTPVDMALVLKMCLFHDLAEARTSDLNYVHQKYARTDEQLVFAEMTAPLSFGKDIDDVQKKYHERTSLESHIAKDADNLDFLLSLCELSDSGNTRVVSWIPNTVKRLKLKTSRQLAKDILSTKPDNWWFAKKDDEWWVNRNGTKN